MKTFEGEKADMKTFEDIYISFDFVKFACT